MCHAAITRAGQSEDYAEPRRCQEAPFIVTERERAEGVKCALRGAEMRVRVPTLSLKPYPDPIASLSCAD